MRARVVLPSLTGAALPRKPRACISQLFNLLQVSSHVRGYLRASIGKQDWMISTVRVRIIR